MLFRVFGRILSVMTVKHYAMLRLVERSCIIAHRKLAVVFRRRPMRWLALMKTVPSLRLSRRRRVSRIERPKVAMELVVLSISSKMILAFEFVVCRNKIKVNCFCLHNFCQYLLVKCCGRRSTGSTVCSVCQYPY